VLVGIGALWLIWHFVQPPEVLYAGKPASVWVKEWIEKPDHTMARESAEISRLREIGPPAVEYLVTAIKKRNYLHGTATYSNLYPRLPAKWSNRLPRPVDPKLVRIRAYWTLGKLRAVSKPAVPFLTRQLVSDTSLRSFVTYALGEIGTNAVAAVPQLVVVLGSPNRDLRFAAGEALAKIDPENTALLKTMLEELKSNDVVRRRLAGYALGLRKPLGSQVASAMIECLADPDLWVRFRAASALFRNHPTNREFMHALVQINESAEASSGLFFEIAQIRPATSESTTLVAESIRRFATPASSQSYREVFFQEFCGTDSNAVPALVELLQDGQNAKLRALAAGALGKVGPAAVAARLALEKAQLDEDENVKRESTKALSLISRARESRDSPDSTKPTPKPH
jgi:HEAT repeat protein